MSATTPARFEGTVERVSFWGEQAEDFVTFTWRGAIAVPDVVDRVHAELEEFMREHGIHKVLFDSRQGESHPEPVRARVWAWLLEAEVVKCSAVVVDSELLRVSANVGRLSNGPRIRSFHNLAEAAEWLRPQVVP